MGANLTIVDDLQYSCYVEVWTAGWGFLVNQGSVTPGNKLSISLGRVWYELKFTLQTPTSEDVKDKSVYLPSDVTIALSSIYGPKGPNDPFPDPFPGHPKYPKDATAKEILLLEEDLATYLSIGGREDDHIPRMIELAKKHGYLSPPTSEPTKPCPPVEVPA